MGRKQSGTENPGGSSERGRPTNLILGHFPKAALEIIRPAIEHVVLGPGETLFEPGDEVTHAHFPLGSAVVALVLPMQDGRLVEAATIGREGAVGGIVSLGLKPAFTRAAVQIPGTAARLSLTTLENAKRAAPKTHDLLARYADCLTAQVLQSVACAAIHPLEARCARWLLMTHDRLQRADLPLTQEALAETLGVARTYVTRIASALQRSGAIEYRRGVIHIKRRSVLEHKVCECYDSIRQHFDRVLPGIYPTAEP